MKKIQKKLVLKKKTISQLSNEQLRQVVGGKAIASEAAPIDPLTASCICPTQTCRTFCPDSSGNHC